jgi:hypothetical protein
MPPLTNRLRAYPIRQVVQPLGSIANFPGDTEQLTGSSIPRTRPLAGSLIASAKAKEPNNALHRPCFAGGGEALTLPYSSD